MHVILTSHKIDCGVVAMVTKCQNGVSVGGDSRVGENICACFFCFVFFKPTRPVK